MKLISGHMYLRGANGEVVPYSEGLAKASGYEQFIQEGDFENDLQLPENQKVVPRKPIPMVTDKQREIEELEKKLKALQQDVQTPKAQQAKPQPAKPQPMKTSAPAPKKLEHMDIRQEMVSDLAGLEE